jgi:hypothetical protein
MRRTKEHVVNEIAEMLGVEAPRMSTGATEPKAIFVLVNEGLGLGLDPKARKEDLARGIVEAAGAVWGADCESRGATVTMKGLQSVEQAVRFFLGR